MHDPYGWLPRSILVFLFPPGKSPRRKVRWKVVQTTCVRVTLNGGGSVSLTFEDGTGLQFANKAELGDFVRGVDAGEAGSDLARRILLAKWLNDDPALTDTTPILHKTCTINLGATNPVQIG